MLLLYFAASFLDWLSGYILNRIVMKVVYDLRKDVEDKLNRLPIGYFDSRQRGDVLSRVTNDIDNIQKALHQAFTVGAVRLLEVLGTGIIMFVLSWQLALIALIALPFVCAHCGLRGSEIAETVCSAVEAYG